MSLCYYENSFEPHKTSERLHEPYFVNCYSRYSDIWIINKLNEWYYHSFSLLSMFFPAVIFFFYFFCSLGLVFYFYFINWIKHSYFNISIAVLFLKWTWTLEHFNFASYFSCYFKSIFVIHSVIKKAFKYTWK